MYRGISFKAIAGIVVANYSEYELEHQFTAEIGEH